MLLNFVPRKLNMKITKQCEQ